MKSLSPKSLSPKKHYRGFLTYWNELTIQFKFLLIIILTALTITVVLFTFFFFSFGEQRVKILRFFEGTLRYAIDQMGEPPQYDVARKITEDTGIEIRYEGSISDWETIPDLPTTNEIINSGETLWFLKNFKPHTRRDKGSYYNVNEDYFGSNYSDNNDLHIEEDTWQHELGEVYDKYWGKYWRGMAADPISPERREANYYLEPGNLLRASLSGEIPKKKKNYYFLLVPLKTGNLIFFINERHTHFNNIISITLLIFVIVMILFLFYLYLRRTLSPFKQIADELTHFSDDRHTARLPEYSSNEFGKISRAFNDMAVKVNNLIDSQKHLLLNVSHELRSPLTRMRLRTEMLENEEAGKDFSEDIRVMELMINELLESAKLENSNGDLKFAPIDPVLLIEDILESESFSREISIEDHTGGCMINGDNNRLYTALKNIIENAVKYSKEDGEVVRVILEKDDSFCIFTVIDKGIGITPSEIGMIFDPFFRADKARTPSRKGFGLGLYLVKAIIEAHSGKITVESTPGEGSTFSIRIPLAK